MNAPNGNALTVAAVQGVNAANLHPLSANNTAAEMACNADFLYPKFENIHAVVKAQPSAVWTAEPKPGKPGKFNKAPRSPKTGWNIGTDKPHLFGTFGEAQAAYEHGGYSGVGVLLTGNGIIGVDIDQYADTFEIIPDVMQWVTRAVNSGVYCEKSPSGAGLRLFMRGTLPGTGRKSGSLEIYDDVRFLTVTGHVFDFGTGGGLASELIKGQHLANQFLDLLPVAKSPQSLPTNISTRTSDIDLRLVSIDVKSKLGSIFAPNEFSGDSYFNLFNGDTSAHNGDHSAADMALVGYMARQGLSPDDVDLVFRASRLYRGKWDEMRGATTYGQRTIAKAFEGLPVGAGVATTGESGNTWWDTLNHGRYRPTYVPGGMPARKFIGPKIGLGIRLFPAASLSTLVALGAVGKTSLLMSIGAHVAAGKDWNGHRVEQQKVAMLFCEETEEELTRKISAIIDGWSPSEQASVMDNLLLVSLLGEDARLTIIERGQYQGSGVAEKIIGILDTFGLKDGLVVIDHMQGFASGDLNISETATSICREANKIVDATGAAVVFAAHISKANIRATELEQGFAVGSLAFENATRQLAGMLPMTEEAAKKFGLEANRHQYAWLGLPKNSYGGTDAGVWLKKEVIQKYHTVVMTPVQLVPLLSSTAKSANEKLTERILAHLSQHPWATRNQLDGLAGSDGPLKASKGKVRDVLSGLLDTGEIEQHPVTDAERLEHGIPKQVKEVLKVKTAAKPAKSADKKNAAAGLKPMLGVA